MHSASLPFLATLNALAFFWIPDPPENAISIKQDHQDEEEKQQLIWLSEYSAIAEYNHQQQKEKE